MSRDAEIAVISTILKDNSKVQELSLCADHFENSTLGEVFRQIKGMTSTGDVADIITVSERLGTARDWLGFLTKVCTESCAATNNIKAYSELVESSFMKRQAIAIGEWLKSNSGESGAVNEAISKLMSLSKSETDSEYDLKGIVKAGLKEIDHAFQNKGKLSGVNTGLNDLNDVLGGFHQSDLIIVGARPAMGKTSVLLNFITGAMQKVGCVSGEQGVAQIAQRLISIRSRVPLVKMRNGKLDDVDFSNLNNGVISLRHHPGIWLADRASPSIQSIESNARKWKFEHDIKALYVDYLQKIKRDPRKSRAEAVGENAESLKNLAKELQIPIICLAQVKREVESRPNKRPFMSDISDSSEIEKEADQIIMLYRDEVYNPDTATPGIMELNIEKNRHGPTGHVCAKWDAKYLSVGNLSLGDDH